MIVGRIRRFAGWLARILRPPPPGLLPELSTEAKRLVNDGVWGLYRTEGAAPTEYVLMAKDALYELDRDGRILPRSREDIGDFKLVEVVRFVDLPPVPHAIRIDLR